MYLINLIDLFPVKKNLRYQILVKIGKITNWRSGTWRPAYTFKPKKIGVCNHKVQLLSGITFTVSLKIKPVIQIYARS